MIAFIRLHRSLIPPQWSLIGLGTLTFTLLTNDTRVRKPKLVYLTICGGGCSSIRKMVFLGLENYCSLNKCCHAKPTLPMSQPQVRSPVPSKRLFLSNMSAFYALPKSPPFRNEGLIAMATGARPPLRTALVE